MNAQVSRRSWVASADLLDLEIEDSTQSVMIWDLPVPKPIVAQPDDLTYVVSEGDRFDIIAHRLYGDWRLGWVLAVANNLDSPDTQLHGGLVLKVPSPRYVFGQYLPSAK